MPVMAKDLHDEVRQLADPQGRGRQFLAATLDKLTNTRMAGFVLTRQASAGKWGAATYALKNLGGAETHRGHRGHRGDDKENQSVMPPCADPMPPYAPDVTPYAPPMPSDHRGGHTGHKPLKTNGRYPMPPMPPMPSPPADDFATTRWCCDRCRCPGSAA